MASIKLALADLDSQLKPNYNQTAKTYCLVESTLQRRHKGINLSKQEAKIIYRNLHSGAMRAKRFDSDESFVKENSIQKIRSSLDYLLYSNDQLNLRIHNLCTNPDFKLNQFGESGTQEIIGWVSPDKYPIRNEKANEALALLGLELD